MAANEDRIVVSHDRKTMPHYFADFIRTVESPGLIIVSQKVDVLTAIEDLLLIWGATEHEHWRNRIIAIPLQF